MANNDALRRPALARDGQQWFFDWMIQETGRVFQYQIDGRRMPKTVRRHEMISKHLGLSARRMLRYAQEEEAAGHALTAMSRYFDASQLFAQAQHTIFENNPEKRYLHGSSLECFDNVRRLAPHRIEHLNIPWEGQVVSGNLHLLDSSAPAPLLFFIGGCDMTKEMFPHPLANPAAARGMHVFSFDGPGQGESNLRGITLTATNYQAAVAAALNVLLERPEIDAAQIVLYGVSFGSHWAMATAAHEHRFKAVVASAASYCSKHYLMNVESPRYKQLFMYLTGSQSEAGLDHVMQDMDLRGAFGNVTCPVLLLAGEYDLRSPLEEIYEMFDLLRSPAELWVFTDQHHQVSVATPNQENPAYQRDSHELSIDWLVDRLNGRPLRGNHGVVRVDPSVAGPNGAVVNRRRYWYEQDQALP